MIWIYMTLAFLGGVFLPLQAGINTQLRVLTGHSIFAMVLSILISLSTGVLLLFLYSLSTHLPWPSGGKLFQGPWWIWTGGIMGAFFVWFTILLAPRLGATVLFGLIVAGQLTASLVIDHLGILGLPYHPINVLRVLGVLLLVSGMVLIRQF